MTGLDTVDFGSHDEATSPTADSFSHPTAWSLVMLDAILTMGSK